MKPHIQLIGASKVFVCDEEFGIIDNGGVAFESGGNQNCIVALGDYEELKVKYTDATFYSDSVILPGFVNSHIHFEFGNNISSFVYGGFDKWLQSVMAKRDNVLLDIQDCVTSGIQEQLRSGVTSVGAISSYGHDLTLLAQSPLRVTYFNEVIGSTPSGIDFLYSDFLARYHASRQLQSYRFSPAIAIHSPYSVHSVLAKKVLELARKDRVLTSTHFLESHFERQWLQEAKGWFGNFYKKVLNITSPQPFYSIEEFINLFEGLDTLFVHCLFASQKEFAQIGKNGSIVSCPRSNRLLNNTYLDLSVLQSQGISPIFATDGKSSNNNLNMLEELRSALFGYEKLDLEDLSKTLILGASANAAKALRLNNGILKNGKWADIAVFQCPQIAQSSQAPLQFLLQSGEVTTLYINGSAVIKDNHLYS
ncbi:aminofutalosine deaminase family hydrolase [Helicobacter sp. 11S03491-1]|uniref:aminofutalosine deaminase family hydrolase n=1 Tax=Helicobacter sp. 11S03491-1 TaxID=1476196 RepID=UPI000BA5415F|nr:aminofutalosine deaminase family hydrolase [Helicobacter sp. 11S03491-1]PAF43069.1 hypothetical protein BKH45_03115 [Helicobacter sp. 11S03491-1]